MSSNYPPGVSGNEPQITGEWPCEGCGETLPEEADCPDCGGVVTYEADELWHCADCEWTADGHYCPGGCPDVEYERAAERWAETHGGGL
jgi:hypothetical protein